MEEDQDTSAEQTCCEMQRPEFPSTAFGIVALVALAAGGMIGHFGLPGSGLVGAALSDQESQQRAMIVSNNNAATENAKMQTAIQKRLLDVQIKMADLCVAKGGYAVFQGGNVDCKPGK